MRLKEMELQKKRALNLLQTALAKAEFGTPNGGHRMKIWIPTAFNLGQAKNAERIRPPSSPPLPPPSHNERTIETGTI